MRIVRDEAVCESHGQCVIAAPDLFDLEDDDDVVTVLAAEPDPDQLEAARKAVHMCPVGALSLDN